MTIPETLLALAYSVGHAEPLLRQHKHIELSGAVQLREVSYSGGWLWSPPGNLGNDLLPS